MKKVRCVRDVRIFREDYEAGKLYEVDDELADRFLRHTTIVGPSAHHCFVLPNEGKKKKAKKKTAKKATGKKPATKRTKKKRTGPASPMTA